MSREDILLKEYEVCQQEMDSSASNYWTTVQIFIGVTTAFLAIVSLGLASQRLDIWALILTLVFSLTVIAMFGLLHMWLKRVNHLIGINNQRQREIELQLGMRKNILVWGLDNWKEIPLPFRRKIAQTWEMDEGEKERVCKSSDKKLIPERYRPPEVGRIVIRNLLGVLCIPWVLIIVIAVLKFIIVN